MTINKKIIAVLFAALFALILTVLCVSAAEVFDEGDFSCSLDDESITITAYLGKDTVVTVPNAIRGYPVNVIAKDVFASNSVKVVYLPDTIMETQSGAFGEGVAVVFSNAGTTFETSHGWDDGVIIKGATCSEEGLKRVKCLICGQTGEVTVPKTSHKFTQDEIMTMPTCADEGSIIRKCTVCGEVEIEIVGVLNVHAYKNNCDPVCSVCGKIRTVTHKPGTKVYADKNGHYFYCTVCGVRTGDEVHKAENKNGASVCSVCGYVITPAAGHVHEIVPVAAVAPTCTDQGNKAYFRCTGCDAIFADESGVEQITLDGVTIPAAGHKPVTKDGKAPTITDGGISDGLYCSVCGAVILTEEEILPLSKLEYDTSDDIPEALTDTAESDASDVTASAGEVTEKSTKKTAEKGEKNCCTIWYILGGAGLAAIIAVVIIVVMRKRKKNEQKTSN